MVRCQDIEMVSLDLHGVADKCPEVTAEQLARLLALRGDVPRALVRDTVTHVLATRPPRAPTHLPHHSHPSLFSDIKFNDRMLPQFPL